MIIIRIAIDIDGVVCDILPLVCTKINEKYGTNLQKHNIDQWNYPINDTDIGVIIRNYLADPAFVLNLPFVEGAKEAIRDLYKHHEIVFATGRPKYAQRWTYHWLADNFLYDDIKFTSEKTVNSLNCDVLIDDSPHYIQKWMNSGAKYGILVDYPYNQNIKGENGLTRVNDWKEITKLINSFDGDYLA